MKRRIKATGQAAAVPALVVTSLAASVLVCCHGFQVPAPRTRLFAGGTVIGGTGSSSADSGTSIDTDTTTTMLYEPVVEERAIIDGESVVEAASIIEDRTAASETTVTETDKTEVRRHGFIPSETTTRRDWLCGIAGAFAAGGTLIGASEIHHRQLEQKPVTTTTTTASKKLAPVNMTQVAQKTDINMTLECSGMSCVRLDKATFQKVRIVNLPDWLPPFLVPKPKVIKDISNEELLTAAILAGSAMEMTRTMLLYPLQTLKSRVQADINKRRRRTQQNSRPCLHLRRRIKILQLNAQRHFREKNLYAGLFPSIAVAVPATGVYYGVRDVTKRMLGPLPFLSDLSSSLMAVLVAEVVSLMVRTPADTLALRLQVATGKEEKLEKLLEEEGGWDEGEADDLAKAYVNDRVGNWLVESFERLPAAVLTDLPYLLVRLVLNKAFLRGGSVDIGHYELTSLATALLAAFCTTPFDVARTRILIDSDDDPTNGIDGGSGEGLLRTFKTITEEGDGGIQNLFAGWFERSIYLALVGLWLPFGIVGYVALRDAILLEWFD
jgi:hypothetical protein